MAVARSTAATKTVLEVLLQTDLGFHNSALDQSPHSIHAFAAKFPPQLPRFFIEALTSEGDVILDPMVGSGTTLVEAVTMRRRAIGIDRDPLAVLLSRVKTIEYDLNVAGQRAEAALQRAEALLLRPANMTVLESFKSRMTPSTTRFLDYWFWPDTQLELAALAISIAQEQDPSLRDLLRVVFSSLIVTKSGGVSRARDLAHSRPHLVETKRPKPVLPTFARRAAKTVRALANHSAGRESAVTLHGDARALPIRSSRVNLIVTSPPYANAIDYVRAHKFSLVWFGVPIERLSDLRGQYIGNERLGAKQVVSPLVPQDVTRFVSQVAERDPHKAGVLRNYFLDMNAAVSEMHRVLIPGGVAVLVIGPSLVRDILVNTHVHIASLMEQRGFNVCSPAERALDRNRRLMPVSNVTSSRGIEKRIHREYVVAGVKS